MTSLRDMDKRQSWPGDLVVNKDFLGEHLLFSLVFFWGFGLSEKPLRYVTCYWLLVPLCP